MNLNLNGVQLMEYVRMKHSQRDIVCYVRI